MDPDDFWWNYYPSEEIINSLSEHYDYPQEMTG